MYRTMMALGLAASALAHAGPQPVVVENWWNDRWAISAIAQNEQVKKSFGADHWLRGIESISRRKEGGYWLVSNGCSLPITAKVTPIPNQAPVVALTLGTMICSGEANEE